MSDGGGLDLNKVIGMIMENPALIEQISSMARSAQSNDKTPAVEDESTTKSISAAVPPPEIKGNSRSNRAQLLGALKPYVSLDRARAIDSMLTIADILDTMKSR